MTWRIEFDERHKLILLTYQEKVSSNDIRESSAAVIAMMHDNDTSRILTDFTDASSLAMSTVDIVLLPQSYRDLGLSVSFTEAIVAPKGSKVRKDAEFYETVCVNRGIEARLFEDRDQAFEWLAR